MEILNRVVFEMTVLQWIIFIAGSILIMLALRLVLTMLAKQMKKHIETSQTTLDDFLLTLVKAIYPLTVFAAGVWIMQLFLPFPPKFSTWFRVFFLLCVYLQLGRWADPIFSYLLRKTAKDEDGEGSASSFTMMVKILSWVAYAILAVMAVDALPGVEATTLITTMGIGGIAIAFALQNVLSDFAAAFTIAFDQPFQKGDSITTDGLSGTVEKIGLKSTRVRSFDGQEIVVSNSNLLNSRINNYKTVERRRVVLNFGVSYETSPQDLQRIPDIVEEIVLQESPVTYARTHSTSLADSWINYETVYYVESSDFNVFMDVRHRINIALLQRFEQEGIELPYRTQTVLLKKQNENS